MDAGVGTLPTPVMDIVPPQQPVVLQAEGVSFGEVGEESDEHTAKRVKLDEHHDPSLNDEAILSALAAHNNHDSVEHYNPELVPPWDRSILQYAFADPTLHSFYGEA